MPLSTHLMTLFCHQLTRCSNYKMRVTCRRKQRGSKLHWLISRLFKNNELSHLLHTWKRIFPAVLLLQVIWCRHWSLESTKSRLTYLTYLSRKMHGSVRWTSNQYTIGTLWSSKTCWDIAWRANEQGSFHYFWHYHRMENIYTASC